jgi:PAS domain S-box-containing protein
MTEKTKKQRDQFLAFSFASADLFIEVTEEGKVAFALGAAKGMTGVDEAELLGKNWLDLFSSYDQAALIAMLETSKVGKRCGPMLVDMHESVAKRKAVLSGIKMPGSDNFYLTLGLSNKMMGKLAASAASRRLSRRKQFFR